MKKPKVLHNFYKSPAWLAARELKIMAVNGLCERCGQIGIEVHHKESLTTENVNDSFVSLNQDNLELLCRECHNMEHKRFSKGVKFDSEGNLLNPEKHR
ncbi:MAG: HNH endonuclease [Firmicutes bacterium]|nr:HNH endonuclease [Bacillota bacterium]